MSAPRSTYIVSAGASIVRALPTEVWVRGCPRKLPAFKLRTHADQLVQGIFGKAFRPVVVARPHDADGLCRCVRRGRGCHTVPRGEPCAPWDGSGPGRCGGDLFCPPAARRAGAPRGFATWGGRLSLDSGRVHDGWRSCSRRSLSQQQAVQHQRGDVAEVGRRCGRRCKGRSGSGGGERWALPAPRAWQFPSPGPPAKAPGAPPGASLCAEAWAGLVPLAVCTWKSASVFRTTAGEAGRRGAGRCSRPRRRTPSCASRRPGA